MSSYREMTGEFVVLAQTEVCREPEHRLMLAVLEDALLTFQCGLNSPLPMRRRYYFEVERWVSERGSDSPFSFESICMTLQFDPDYIREGLVQMKRRALQTAAVAAPRKIRREPVRDRGAWRGQIGHR